MSESTDGYALLRNLAAQSGMPVAVHLQIADRCNHACGHCYQVQGQKGELGLGELKALLDDLASTGILMLNVSGGEATLRHDLVPILEYARSKGFAIRLYTNAYAIDDVLAERLARVGLLEVHTSVYSDREEEHDRVTGVPGSLRATLQGVSRLRQRQVRVVLKTPLLRVAPGANERMPALAERLGCGLQMSSEVTPAEDGSLRPTALAIEPEELIADGMLQPWSPTNDPAERADKLGAGSCGVCRSSVAVLSNGEVRPCTDTVVALGNLTRTRFRDLYTHSEEVAFFRQITWNDVHGCRDCDLITACSRCHASAALEQGDYLGPYESACARARARYAAAAGSAALLDPLPSCEPKRKAELGPYKIESKGHLRPVPDRRTALDEARVQKFPWIRPNRSYFEQMLGGEQPKERLIPLRTPKDRPSEPGLGRTEKI